MKTIFDHQINLLKKVKDYLDLSKKKNIDTALSPLCFMTTWTKTVGYYKILQLLNKQKFLNKFFILKDMLSISKFHDIYIHSPDKLKDYKVLIISYCTKKNFDKEGNFSDSYFSYSSKDKDFCWLLVSLDDYLPEILKKNIFIVRKKTKKKYNIFFLIKKIIQLIFKEKIKIKNILHYLSSQYIFAEILMAEVYKKFKKQKFKKTLINYEGIPFQHGIIKSLSKISRETKFICYLHCAPWPVQTDLFFREELIDILLVSGDDQKNILSKFLGWPDNKIRSIPSLRFKKEKTNKFSGYLFVPYEIFDSKQLLSRFNKFLSKIPNGELANISTRIHPLNQNSEKHKKFEKKLIKIIEQHKVKFSPKKNNISIMFGYATGVCIQALEEGNTIYHFPYNNITDVFSEKIWHNIKIEKIDNLIFKYNIKNKNRIFFTNHEINKFEKYVKPLLN